LTAKGKTSGERLNSPITPNVKIKSGYSIQVKFYFVINKD